MKKFSSFVILFITGLMLLTACAAGGKSADLTSDELLIGGDGTPVFTAYNIWYEPGKETQLWCINYKTGNFIPAGTEVKNVALSRAVAGRKAGAELLALSFELAETGEKFWVNITKKFHPGKTIRDYANLMFTQKNFEQLTQGFSENELDAIHNGVLKVGMSKPAVIVSYGIPPEHRTPDLESDTWMYWMNRFRSKTIYFDANGRTKAPPVKPADQL